MFDDLFVDTRTVLVELSIIPMNGNGQNNNLVVGMLDILEKSGLVYEYSRNSASIEGNWNVISPLIYSCYERIQEQFPQGFLIVSIR